MRDYGGTMPYSIENKAIQIKTVCRGCGKQPVEWHNPEHKNHLGRRVHALVSLGYPVERIAAEMGTCTPLCRHCHMLLDGRLSKLIAARPYKKGDCLQQSHVQSVVSWLNHYERVGVLSAPRNIGKIHFKEVYPPHLQRPKLTVEMIILFQGKTYTFIRKPDMGHVMHATEIMNNSVLDA
jgi:hypothetical protein